MSRSLHATYRSLAKLRRQDFSDTRAHLEAISAEKAELRRKGFAKRQVLAERHPPAIPDGAVLVPAGAIPIQVSDVSEHVFHAASPADVRAVLEALPPAAVEGIARVRLSLGLEYMIERDPPGEEFRDPLTGRPGGAVFPGVYAGRVLGTHFPASGDVAVYAYVVDWRRVLAPLVVVELYLRLHALKTLVHEVAHFHDHVARVSRGRWLADRRENNEWYAEKMEHEWTEEVVLPVLHRLYPRECRQFRTWLRQRGGADLPLGFFAGDFRRTQRNGMTRLVSPTSDAFECWLEKLPGCASRSAASLSLAWALHYSECYEQCLTLVDQILAGDPSDVKARECRIDTLVHLERYDEVLAEADAILATAPGSAPAWEGRCDVFEARDDWAGLLTVCAAWAPVVGRSPGPRRDWSLYRAVACCALGDEFGMDACLADYARTLRGRPPEVVRRRMEIRRLGVLRRAGKAPPI